MNDDEIREIAIRPVRLTTSQYAELKRVAEVSRVSVAAYVTTLIEIAIEQFNVGPRKLSE